MHFFLRFFFLCSGVNLPIIWWKEIIFQSMCGKNNIFKENIYHCYSKIMRTVIICLETEKTFCSKNYVKEIILN